MKHRITPHLRRAIAAGSRSIELQYAKMAMTTSGGCDDPLAEQRYTPVKGVVHKFGNRVLVKVSLRCAAHCQFCTRIREIGNDDGDLSSDEIIAAVNYIREHSEVDDVILSGGDPLYSPGSALPLLEALRAVETVRIVRVGTRLPIHSPKSVASRPVQDVLKALTRPDNNYQAIILVHVNHPDELDLETVKALKVIKGFGLTVVSQTVFLKEINCDVETLAELFRNLFHIGVLPYYIYHCDAVAGLERFTCSIDDERTVMTELYRKLSGLALPRYIVDVAGVGKIPVPLGFWEVPDLRHCTDYEGRRIEF